MQLPELIDKRQLAEHLGVTTRTIERWAATGELPPPIPIGRLRRWRSATIAAFLDRRERQAQTTST